MLVFSVYKTKETGKVDRTLNHFGTIPEGATYTQADGTVLNADDSFPETLQPLDAYRYGDYTYVYSASRNGYVEPYTESFNNQFEKDNYNGWLVTIIQEDNDGSYYGYILKKNEYGAILESINGQPITNVDYTFANCTSLTGTITINANPTSYKTCFSSVDMSKIAFAGSCDATLKQQIANTGVNGSLVTIIN